MYHVYMITGLQYYASCKRTNVRKTSFFFKQKVKDAQNIFANIRNKNSTLGLGMFSWTCEYSEKRLSTFTKKLRNFTWLMTQSFLFAAFEVEHSVWSSKYISSL